MTKVHEKAAPFTPFDPEHVADPAGHLRTARRECPVRPVNDLLYVVTSDAAVRDVFDDTTRFSSRGNFVLGKEDRKFPVPVITMVDAPLHTRLRDRLLRSFTPARLRRLAPRVDEIVASSLSQLPDSGEVELYQVFIKALPSAVIYALIGLPEESWPRVQELSDVLVAAIPAPTVGMPEFAELTGFFANLADERRASPNDRRPDVLDTLCFAEDGEEEFSSQAIMMHLMQLTNAGTDTTRALITNCLYRLLDDPSQWRRVVEDRSLLPNAIEESLRVDSPGTFMVRNVIEDVEIGGCPVTAGHKAYLSIQSANHDEAVWGENSLEYQHDREGAAAHIAFGRGVHSCLGAPLARIEARAAISALMDRYPNMTLASHARWTPAPGAFTRRVERLDVVLAPETAR